MNMQHVPAQTALSHEPHSGSNTQLHGGKLLVARFSLLAIIVLALVLYIVGTPVYYAQLFPIHQHCFEDCPDPTIVQSLHVLGISNTIFALYLVALNVLFALVYFSVAVLIFWRKSDDWMALLASFALVAFGASFPSIPTTLAAIHPAWLLPVTIVGNEEVLGFPFLIIFLLLFPTGRFVPRWTRWVAVGYAALSASGAFLPGSPFSFWNWPRPLLLPVLLVIYGSVAFALVYRYRRVSTPIERQQTKWIAFGSAVALLGFLLLGYMLPALLQVFMTLPSLSLLPFVIVLTSIYLVLLLIPLSIANAILRYRLWDVDVLINKTLVYGLLTGILITVYAFCIVVLEAFLQGLFKQTSAVAIVVSTIVIFALFQPLRRRIQSVIDRRFFRRKYDAARTLAAFAATLQNEVDLNQISEDLIAVVQETMQPSHVSLWLCNTKPSGGRNTRVLPEIDEEKSVAL